MTRRRPNGFTLLELMIAVTLVALIVTVVYGAYRATIDGSRRCRIHLNLYREAVTLCDQLKSQLQASHSIIDPTAPNQNSLVLIQSDQGTGSLRFVTSVPLLMETPSSGLYEVSWKTGSDGRQLYCERPFIAPGQFKSEPPFSNYRSISQASVELNLSPLDRSGTIIPNGADRASRPHAVRIDLTVYDPQNPETSFAIHTLAPLVSTHPNVEQIVSLAKGR